MGIGRAVLRTLAGMERAAQQASAAQRRAQARAVRDGMRAQRAYERQLAANDKERARLYVQSRVAEVEADNAELEQRIAALGSILQSALGITHTIDLDTLKQPPVLPNFDPGALGHILPGPSLSNYLPPVPGWLAKLIPGAKAKHERLDVEARRRFKLECNAPMGTERGIGVQPGNPSTGVQATELRRPGILANTR